MKDGTKFGPYQLIRRVGVGGMAEVYMAKTSGIGGFEKVLALKVIHSNYAADEEFVNMLVDEAKLCVQLTHRNIAQVFDLGFVDGRYFIAMEFIDGKDLYQLMVKCAESSMPIPFDLVAYVGTEMTNGLHYAHARSDNYGRPLNLIHRDVSPQNVLLSHEGEVKLADFGIAKADQGRQQTEAGVIKGKFCYMSPEQAWGEELDARSDVFACGICLYEMAAGQMLFMDGGALELLDKVRRADIAPLSSVRSDIPPELERIIHRALERDCDDRYLSAAEMQADLASFLHQNWPRFNCRQLGGFIRTVFGDQRFVLPEPEEKPTPKKTDSTVEIMRAAEFDRSGVHSVIFDLANRKPMNDGSQFEESEDPTIASDFIPMPGDLNRVDAGSTTTQTPNGPIDRTRLLPEIPDPEDEAEDDGADRTVVLSEISVTLPAQGSNQKSPLDHIEDDEELEGPTIVFDSSVVARAISHPPRRQPPENTTNPMRTPLASTQDIPKPVMSSDERPPPVHSPLVGDLPDTSVKSAENETSPLTQPIRGSSDGQGNQRAHQATDEQTAPKTTRPPPPAAKAKTGRRDKTVTTRKKPATQVTKNTEGRKRTASSKGLASKFMTVPGISALVIMGLAVYVLVTLLPGFLAEPSRDRAWLLVESQPPGARVLIDGKDSGKVTNARVQELKLGEKHRVQLELKGHATHAAYIRLDEKNTGGSPLTGTYRVTLKHTGTVLKVVTIPEGADIYVDGLYLGTSPIDRKDLERKGNVAELLIQKKGFVDQSKRVPWSEKNQIKLDIKLRNKAP